VTHHARGALWRGRAGIRDDPDVSDAAAGGRTLAPHLPDLSGFRLSGRRLRLSAAIEGPTLLVVSFDQGRRPLVDAWVSRAVGEMPGVTVLEVAVFARSDLWRRGVIDGGMIDAIGDLAVLQRTITVYTDLEQFAAATGIPDRSTVSVLAVEPGGAILATVTGSMDEDSWAEVRASFDS
jgi:hypothetical protein